MPPQPVTLTPSSIIKRHGDPTLAGLREWRDVLEQKYETSIISVWFINRKKAIASNKCCNVTQSWWRWVCVTKACAGCGEIVPRPEIWIILVIRTFIRTQLTLETLETLVLRTSDQYHEMSALLAAAHPLITPRTLSFVKTVTILILIRPAHHHHHHHHHHHQDTLHLVSALSSPIYLRPAALELNIVMSTSWAPLLCCVELQTKVRNHEEGPFSCTFTFKTLLRC